ncbi:MAG: NYN domain-containing protein [Patescibacteria group bacterium]
MKKVNKLQTLKGFRDVLPIKISPEAKVGVFIDEANLFYIQKELGWKIDWQKFIDLLKKNLNIKLIRYYLGMPLSGNSKIKNLKFKTKLESFGYTVITKPLKKIYINKKLGKYEYKCNFDVEIAIDTTKFLKDLDLVIICSSDSDFVALRDYVLINKKKILFLCFERKVSWEVRRSKNLFLERFRAIIELKNKNPGKTPG